MASLIIIGDSHLEQCYNRTKANKFLNLGFSNLKVHWEKGHEQLKNIEKLYKDIIVKLGQPNIVVVMCGGYELMLSKEPKSVANKLKSFVHFLRSSNVQFVIVCSLLDRRCVVQKEEDSTNKEIRNTNKMLSKIFKDQDNVFFINIRPPGNVKNIIGDDRYHLKENYYDHVYKRLVNTLNERVLLNFPDVQVVSTVKKTETDANEHMDNSEPREGSKPKKNCQVSI